MSTFVLVHGGWHGAWCWRDVARALRAAGHDVHTPTLSGLGERAHLLEHLGARVDLALHVRDVVEELACHDLRDVVLVGHSYAGMVVGGVADRAPERVAHVVYLDAFVPADGRSLFDLLLPERRALYQQAARERGDGWLVPAPPAAALGVTGPEQAAWVEARLTPQPLRTFEQPLALARPAGDGAVPCSYVHCTEGPVAASFAPFAGMAQEAPGWHHRELPCGHDAMLALPGRVTALLLEAATTP